jgi:cytidylate kinase
VASIVAQKLNWHQLDSGAIYRAFTIAATDYGIGIDNLDGLLELAGKLDLEFKLNSEQAPLSVYLDGVDITTKLRMEETATLASKYAQLAPLRKVLLVKQRQFQKPPGLVADGRDMGTVVFPDAPFKVFLTADPEERAKRRLKQLQVGGNTGNISHTLAEVQKRDERDKNRAHSPLKPAKDALIIDTTNLTIDEVISKVMAIIEV